MVSEAKPLLERLQTPLLRLQLVKRLAEASGFSQQEVERLCDLRPVVRAAPAKAPESAKPGEAELQRFLVLALLIGPATEQRLVKDFAGGTPLPFARKKAGAGAVV